MKKFIFVLFEILAFVMKTVLLFTLVIVGIDLIGRAGESKKGSEANSNE